MIGVNFGRWHTAAGGGWFRTRIYWRLWTPFVRVRRQALPANYLDRPLCEDEDPYWYL